MASAKASKEPSMEDILASIRQIIADDDNKAPESDTESVDSGEPANDQAAIDAAFDNIDDDDDAGMAVDDIDALFDEASGSEDEADEDEDDDVLTLTNDEPVPAAPDIDDDISFDGADLDDMPDEITVEVANETPSAAPPQPAATVIPEDLPSDAASALMSDAASASVRQSFGALSSAMTVSRSTTIEDLMSEMMRPMLKAWLDENLPPMVERMVKAEIERMRG
ncbi:MAG: DUF2497 domain-containing protein [Pseudomonadota bacterium]